jgi:hypothetical protein
VVCSEEELLCSFSTFIISLGKRMTPFSEEVLAQVMKYTYTTYQPDYYRKYQRIMGNNEEFCPLN